MKKNRIDFKKPVIQKVRENAGNVCCNPNCLVLVNSSTSQVCHIYGASKGGPRGQNGLEKEFIESEKNGILLCKNHHGLADCIKRPVPDNELFLWKNVREFSHQFLIENLDIAIQFTQIGIKSFDNLIWSQLKTISFHLNPESHLNLKNIIDTDLLKSDCNTLYADFLRIGATGKIDKPNQNLNKITNIVVNNDFFSNEIGKKDTPNISDKKIPSELYEINEIKKHWFSTFRMKPNDLYLITNATCYIGSTPSEIITDKILLEMATNVTVKLSAPSLHSSKDNFFHLIYDSDFFILNLSIVYENNSLNIINQLTPIPFPPRNINLNKQNINHQAKFWKKIINNLTLGKDLFVLIHKNPHNNSPLHSKDDLFPYQFKIQKENLSSIELNRTTKTADRILLANELVRIIEGKDLSGTRFNSSDYYFSEHFSESNIITAAYTIRNKIDNRSSPYEGEISETYINHHKYKFYLNYSKGNIYIKKIKQSNSNQ